MVFFIGGIMVLGAITMAIITATFIDAGYGAQAVNVAEATATAGAEDAYLQIIRNSTVSSTYTFADASSSANVVITPSTPSAGLTTVLSTATVKNRTRKVQVVFSVDPTTGRVALVSWGDVP